jgi:alpha-glucosidase (family GH31 glycosyl hydrolase)
MRSKSIMAKLKNINRLLLVSVICCLFVTVPLYSQFYIYKNYIEHRVAGNKLSITTDGGLIEIQAWDNDVIRFSYDKDYKGDLSLQPVVIKAPENISVVISEDSAALYYETETMKIKINKKPLMMEYYKNDKLLLKDTLGGFFYYEGYNYHGIKFSLRSDEAIYGFGSQANDINRRNFSIQMQQINRFGYEWPLKANLNFAVPFFMSSYHYGIYFDDLSPGVVYIDTDEKNVFRFNTVNTKFSFFLISEQNYAEILKKYTELTGRQGLPPRWAMGYLQSRAYYMSEKEVRDIVEQMKAENFIMDAIVFDATWYGGLDEMGNMFWSVHRFPTYQEMIKDFADDGIHVITITQLYISPLSKHYDNLKRSKLVCRNKENNPVFCRIQDRDSFLVYDLTNPSTLKWWWGLYKEQMKYGVEGWWLDGGEPEIYPNNILHSNGKTVTEYSNLINFHWLELIYNGFRTDYPQLRPFIMTRSGWAGAQRFSAFPLCGDEARTWAGLKAMVPVMLGASMSGMSYLHTDIGGFAASDHLMREELYIRWFQLGAFSPVMRAHRTVPVPSEPIFYQQYVRDIVRELIYLRYSLLPYNYTLAYHNTVDGLPLMKPIDFYEPDNELLRNINDEFLWGEDFLVAPVLDSVFQREVVFPGGKWYDWFTGKEYEGHKKYTIETPIEKLPLFVKEGAIIPTSEIMLNTKNYNADSLVLHYFPDTNMVESKFTMFNDNGKNPNSISEKQYELLNFEGIAAANKIHFTLTSVSADGKYISAEKRRMKLCVHNIPFIPYTVQINSKKIKVETSSATLIGKNEYAVYVSDKKELWVYFGWNNDSTLIIIDNSVSTGTGNDNIQNVGFTAEQFSPNPFSDVTTLQYFIDKPMNLDCAIYDVNLRLIRKWSFSHHSPGVYTIAWDGKDFNNNSVSSGIYFLTLFDRTASKVLVRSLFKIR